MDRLELASNTAIGNSANACGALPLAAQLHLEDALEDIERLQRRDLAERPEQVGVGAVPAVDRLIGIADDA